MAKQTYLKRDLIDYVDGEVESPNSDAYYSGSRVDWVVENLPASASVQYWQEGGYQGKLAFVIRLSGYVWVYNDYYGSCSGCDAFLANSKSYMEDLLRGAYCFRTEADAIEYIESTDDYSWNGVVEPMKRMIRNPEKHLKNPKTRFVIRRKESSPEKYSEEVSGFAVENQKSEQ